MEQNQQKEIPLTPRRKQWVADASDAAQRGMERKFWLQMKAGVLREAESIIATAEAEGREFTAGEEAWYEQVKGDLEFINRKLAPLNEKLEAERAEAAKGFQQRTADADAPDHVAQLRLLQRDVGRGRSYADLFGPPVRGTEFRSFNDFAAAVYHGIYQPGLVMAGAGMREGIPSAGGFLVPEEHAAMLLDKSLESEIVRPRALVVPMVTNTKKVAGFANQDNSTKAPYGGLSLQWLDEGGTISLKDAKTRLITLQAKKAGVLVPVSNELLEDGTTFEEQLAANIISAVGWGMDDAFLTGDGAGKPLGVLSAPSLVTVAKEPGQAAATLVYENITKMYARMHPSCIPNAVWVANVTTVPQLLTMQVGTGATNTWYPVSNERNGSFSMLGRPVLFTEKLPTLGAKGDILFADFSQYVIGLRKEITLDKSGHVGFATDETHIRCLVRVDGQPIWEKAFIPKSGNSLSWAVTLEAR